MSERNLTLTKRTKILREAKVGGHDILPWQRVQELACRHHVSTKDVAEYLAYSGFKVPSLAPKPEPAPIIRGLTFSDVQKLNAAVSMLKGVIRSEQWASLSKDSDIIIGSKKALEQADQNLRTAINAIQGVLSASDDLP